jgi:putative OPT family oligopeptide transporter
MIIGVRYASIIMAGSLLAFFGMIPLFGYLNPTSYGAHSYMEIFRGYTGADGVMVFGVRNIGIGGIFAAGVISILKMSKVIKQALQQVLAQIFKKHAGSGESGSRLERDIKMSTVLLLGLVLAVVIFVYFRFVAVASEPNASGIALISLIMTFLIVFLFTAVSAWAIAMISVTPISGMTITTLILAALILSTLGLKGQSGMLAILLIGGVVCTALSMAGSLVTQFKVGQWLGSTPSKIAWSNILGSALASLVITAVIILFARVYGFGQATAEHPNPLPAPQASAMAAVANAFLGTGNAPWMLYLAGAVIAVAISMLGISPLAFALGMYLPIELNSPILLGACVGWLIMHSSKDEKTSKARSEKGILIASGLIAGGALAGVFDALSKTLGFVPPPFLAEGVRNWLGLFVFLALATWLYWDSKKAKAEH